MAEDVEHRRRLGERHLLLEDHLLHEREPAAARFLRPGQADEAGLVQLPLPAAEQLVGFRARNVGALAQPRHPVLPHVLRAARREPRRGRTSCSGVSVKSIHPPARGGGVTEVDRDEAERRFSAHDTSLREKVSRSSPPAGPSEGAVYSPRHGHLRDHPAAPEGPHRDALHLRSQRGRPRHHALLLEPGSRAGARVAASAG